MSDKGQGEGMPEAGWLARVTDSVRKEAADSPAVFAKSNLSRVDGELPPRTWEFFCDPAYYDIWAVRPVGDTSFTSQELFHVPSRGEAEALAAKFTNLEAQLAAVIAERDEARANSRKLNRENQQLAKSLNIESGRKAYRVYFYSVLELFREEQTKRVAAESALRELQNKNPSHE